MSYDPSKPSLVPELVLKKKANLDRLAIARKDRLKAQGNNKVFKKNRNNIVKVRPPSKFISSSLGKLNNSRRYKRVMKKGLQSKKKKKGEVKEEAYYVDNGEDVEEEEEGEGEDSNEEGGDDARRAKSIVTKKANSLGSPVVFCVRILPDSPTTPPVITRTLNKHRLRNLNEGVFLKYTKQVRLELECVENYVVYGVVSKPVIRDLLTRLGHCKVEMKEGGTGGGGKERVPITNNVVIEDEIGSETGCICVDDIVEVLGEGGEGFKRVNNFVWPFRLNSLHSGMEVRKLGMKGNGKEIYGDKGEGMEEFLKKIM